ncbi:MAG: hypothetical protein GT598_10500 [Bacteroidales bacterium]|nr:hypothetical protein [Bacteroidales bacterium]HQG76325.1 hypothetical protein [Bacteroidales bacterium]
MDHIIVREVLSRSELKKFISLPHKIHKTEKNWLPTMYTDDRKLFSKSRNRYFRHYHSILLLAYRDRIPAGRVVALVRKDPDAETDRSCRFCYMDAYDDPQVVHALVERIEIWAREKGADRIIGPLGFSIKDPHGFQVEGFGYPPIIATANNSPWMPRLIENEGFEKDIDLVNYVIDIPEEYPPFYRKAFERILGNRKIRIVEFRNRKDIKPYIIQGLELMNETYSEHYGYISMTDEDKQEFAREYLPVLDPEFIKIVEYDGEIVSFIIGLPDFNQGIIASKGRLLPLGFIRILRSFKRSKKLIFVLGGIKKSFRGMGLDILMAVRMFESGLKHKMEFIDSHLIVESNQKMRAEFEIFNGKLIKRFRIYKKTIRT